MKQENKNATKRPAIVNGMLRLAKRLGCTFGFHRMKFTNVLAYHDISWVKEGMPSVYYVKTCNKCGDHKSGQIYGCSAKTADELNP